MSATEDKKPSILWENISAPFLKKLIWKIQFWHSENCLEKVIDKTHEMWAWQHQGSWPSCPQHSLPPSWGPPHQPRVTPKALSASVEGGGWSLLAYWKAVKTRGSIRAWYIPSSSITTTDNIYILSSAFFLCELRVISSGPVLGLIHLWVSSSQHGDMHSTSKKQRSSVQLSVKGRPHWRPLLTEPRVALNIGQTDGDLAASLQKENGAEDP